MSREVGFKREKERGLEGIVCCEQRKRGSDISLRGVLKEKPRLLSLGKSVNKNWNLIALPFSVNLSVCKGGLTNKVFCSAGAS